ncbi:DinB family protein [Gracilibacillus sp. HCP3S3_G5_1]|uniref:DinB family protein n=1 Tax=unclassified Gracilibacillus TaxID=2625209 RepID=UPI003F886D32
MVQDADLPKFPDHDQHNEEAMTFIKDYSVETIIDNFVLTRKELTERFSSLDGDVRFTIGGGKRKLSGESFTKIFVKHDAHHLKQITDKLHN